MNAFVIYKQSRYMLMMVEGLLQNGMKVSATNQAFHLGKPLIEDVRSFDTVSKTDLIFMPSLSHFYEEDVYREITRRDLWRNVVYCDYRDEGEIDRGHLSKVRVYVRRSPTEFSKPLIVPYGAFSSYFHFENENVVRNIQISYLFDSFGRNCDYRKLVGEWLDEWCGTNEKWIRRKTTNRSGRVRLFDPPQNNSYLEYLKILKRSKNVVTVPPDHGGGDHRTWEALASGATIIYPGSYRISGVQPNLHYLPFESKKGLFYNLTRERDSSFVSDFIRNNHTSKHRVLKILNQV